MEYSKFKYVLCPKSGDHDGEIVNMICLNKECCSDNLLCAICYELYHLGHETKSLKSFISQIHQFSQNINSQQFNITSLNSHLNDQRQSCFDIIKKEKDLIQQQIEKIEQVVQKFYDEMMYQISCQSISSDTVQSITQQIQEKQVDYDSLRQNIKVLMDVKNMMKTPIVQDQHFYVKLQENVQNDVKQFNFEVKQNFDDLNKKLKEFELYNYLNIQKIGDQIIRTKQNFAFNSLLHAQNLEIINPQVIKSNKTPCAYRFALIQTILPNDKMSRFGLKYHNYGDTSSKWSNWVALGISQQSSIKALNYAFQPSQLNHGSYLISSNGGIWNPYDSTKNNVVKSFKFQQDEVIVVEYDPLNKNVTFWKKDNQVDNKYTFELQSIEEFNPSVLIYSPEFEVTIINDV